MAVTLKMSLRDLLTRFGVSLSQCDELIQRGYKVFRVAGGINFWHGSNLVGSVGGWPVYINEVINHTPDAVLSANAQHIRSKVQTFVTKLLAHQAPATPLEGQKLTPPPAAMTTAVTQATVLLPGQPGSSEWMEPEPAPEKPVGDVVDLKAASCRYQRVRGTSPSAVYTFCARVAPDMDGRGLNAAARYKGGTLSFRLAGSLLQDADVAAALTEQGFIVHSEHTSIHLSVGSRVLARKSLLALLGAVPVVWTWIGTDFARIEEAS